jgi:hypothetical protein
MSMKEAIVRQYHAPLKMLRKAIELCPESLWLEGTPNRFWHIAYHTLFYTHFYLAPAEAHFVAWPQHRADYNFLGAPPRGAAEAVKAEIPYSRAEMLEYADFCLEEAEIRTAEVDLDGPSGFYWLPFDKAELQFYNIRHLAHHTGQLIERLRSKAGVGVPWVR